jgi:hypothetical protein
MAITRLPSRITARSVLTMLAHTMPARGPRLLYQLAHITASLAGRTTMVAVPVATVAVTPAAVATAVADTAGAIKNGSCST